MRGRTSAKKPRERTGGSGVTNIEVRLKSELKKLKELLNYGDQLKVEWIPNKGSNVFGEVKGDTILIYVEAEEAVKSLRHEFIDFCISKQIIKPLLKYINLQKCLIEDLVYDRKEKLVNKILKLFELLFD